MSNRKPRRRLRKKFAELKDVEVLPQPGCGPEPSWCDCGLFPIDGTFSCVDADSRHLIKLEKHVKGFLIQSSRNGDFEKVRKLAYRWQKIVDNDDLHVEE
ncbi:hypothetical protein KIN20_020231 [Parelaphostrongylus tenuis]|uniref:Uncharacterized protein n=1 Tax=Parelaphostrongylus tenuis TaxID=148309 RepID=A0AAD5QTE4_PARTN|nr:hypothetical protein KIN20_020231 [Parelaphostrongylus tenuis]